MAAPAGTYNIICDQGSTLDRTLTWKDSDGVLINLTGYTARMQVRATFESTTTVLSLTTENGGITLGGALGTIQIIASATATAAIDPRIYVYDLELVNGTTVYRLVQGSFTVRPEVTR